MLFDGKPADLPYNPVNQISYRLDLARHAEGLPPDAESRKRITEHRVTDHGNAWALYFKDPEGNPVELYVDLALLSRRGPCGEPLDLDQPERRDPASFRPGAPKSLGARAPRVLCGLLFSPGE